MNGFISTKCCLSDFFMWRKCSVSTEINSFKKKCICCTEHTSHIISTPHIFQYSNHRNLFRFLKFFNRLPVQFFHRQLAHGAVFGCKCKGRGVWGLELGVWGCCSTRQYITFELSSRRSACPASCGKGPDS